jgi:biopolymer transport protein ExbD
LLLLADRQVPHGDVMAAVNLARSAGVQRVNVGVKPD